MSPVIMRSANIPFLALSFGNKAFQYVQGEPCFFGGLEQAGAIGLRVSYEVGYPYRRGAGADTGLEGSSVRYGAVCSSSAVSIHFQ